MIDSVGLRGQPASDTLSMSRALIARVQATTKMPQALAIQKPARRLTRYPASPVNG